MNTCLGCGIKFKPYNNRKTQKFHSYECGSKFNYKRRGVEYGREATHKRYLRLHPNYDVASMPKCALCGKKFVQLGNHVYLVHNITAREYKSYLGIDNCTSLIHPDIKKLKSDFVFENGTVENLFKDGSIKSRYKPGDKNAGRYERSIQTKDRLKKLHLFNKSHKQKK